VSYRQGLSPAWGACSVGPPPPTPAYVHSTTRACQPLHTHAHAHVACSHLLIAPWLTATCNMHRRMLVVVSSPVMQPLPEQWSVTTHPWAIYLRLPLAAWVMAATCTLMWKLTRQAVAVQLGSAADTLSGAGVASFMLPAWTASDILRSPPLGFHTALQELVTPGVRRMCKYMLPLCSPPLLLPLLPPPGWPPGILPAVGWALASCALLWLLVQGLPRVLETWWDQLQGAYRSRSHLADP
jgi:hypothetical protein